MLGCENGEAPMPEIVRIARDGAVGLIALNNPPVNAASHSLRAGLVKAVAMLEGDDTVQVIALYGEGRGFIAGADIREFGTPPQEPLAA
jgi:3-hydroxyacyl-CoA dehydrogenase